MPIDFAGLGTRPRSILDYQKDEAELRQNALAAQASQLGYENALQAQRDNASMRTAVQGFGQDPTANYNSLLATGNLKGAQDYLKGTQDTAKTASDIKLNNSHAAHFDTESEGLKQEQQLARTQQHLAQLDAVNDVPAAGKWLQEAVGSGELPLDKAGQVWSQLQAHPESLATWKQGAKLGGMKLVDNMKLTTQSADNAATNDTSRTNNAATNATHLQAAGIAASTSRSNNADTIKKDLTVAGLNSDGSVNGNVEQMAQAIAKGQVAPLSGFALARPAGQQVMARVMSINPTYDATEYGAKVKAAKDFTSGSQGNALRSFAVAGQHLDQLGTLVDALGNGNMQIVNKIGNAYATQTGSPIPTNFDAAKDVVSKEVVKAIVAGGGGVSEREELSRLMSNAKSPAQLKGVITQYRNLMGAQHDALLQQRQAAGLSDSTLPNYNPATPASDLHSQAQAILRGSKK